MILKKLLKKLGSLTDPRPYTLEEWIERHRSVIQADVESIVRFVPENGLFIDVGANVGLFTECLLALRPGCEAFLFEPVPEYFRHCQKRHADNPRVQVFPCGIGPDPGTHTIYKAKHNYGGNCLVEELVHDDRECSEVNEDAIFTTEQIELVDFTAFAAEHGIEDVDFIKTDTEGYDYAVLESMLPWLRERTRLPVIMSEILSPTFHTRAAQQDEVVRALVEIGYKDVLLPEEPKIYDVVFIPRDLD